jgi:hypothetical protein
MEQAAVQTPASPAFPASKINVESTYTKKVRKLTHIYHVPGTGFEE